MSISTSNNAFKYTSGQGVYVASENQLTDLQPNTYIDCGGNTLVSSDPFFYLFKDVGSSIPANTPTTVAQCDINMHSYMLLSVMIPLYVDNFVDITSQSVTVTVKVNNKVFVNESFPLSNQPVTMFNNSFTLYDIPKGKMTINVESPIPCKYLIGKYGLGLVLVTNANTAICF